MRVSILGCGWLGIPLAEKLLKNEVEVFGSTTSEEKMNFLKEKGIKPFLIDITNFKEQLINQFLTTDVLIVMITSKDTEAYKSFISFVEQASVNKVIFISSTSVYSNLNREVFEEDADENLVLVQIEKLFQNNQHFSSAILRFGGLFGYDRQPGNWFAGRKIPQPKGFVNMIHQEDCIAIIEEIINKNCWNKTFNACSNHHPSREDFYINARKKIGKELPEFETSKELSYKIVNSDKLMNALNYQFIHKDLLAI